MPRAGAYLVSDLPEGPTAIHCPKCGRAGRYRKDTLLRRFGPDMPPPTVLNVIANCPRRASFSNNCGAVYSEPLGALR